MQLTQWVIIALTADYFKSSFAEYFRSCLANFFKIYFLNFLNLVSWIFTWITLIGKPVSFASCSLKVTKFQYFCLYALLCNNIFFKLRFLILKFELYIPYVSCWFRSLIKSCFQNFQLFSFYCCSRSSSFTPRSIFFISFLIITIYITVHWS